MRRDCFGSCFLIPIILFILSASGPASAVEPALVQGKQFELLDGDRVVFLGNTLIEREQKYGDWELMLTMAWPERNVTFRNLGWSGDTVWGESRAGFGTQADGFKALVKQVNAAKPTVIFVGYGNVEAFDGEAGLPRFIEGFNKLLDELEKTKARIVVLGPTLQIERLSLNPFVKQYNSDVEHYATELRKCAEHRRHTFIDLISASKEFNDPRAQDTSADNMSVDGITLGPLAYMILAPRINDRFERRVLPLGVVSSFYPTTRPAVTGELISELRQLIVKKNELFFHRWRPQNETYLFGFRKHEQGQNAQEVFDFDPLIATEERKIAELRVKLAAELKKASESK